MAACHQVSIIVMSRIGVVEAWVQLASLPHYPLFLLLLPKVIVEGVN